jgi:hypothetical protein
MHHWRTLLLAASTILPFLEFFIVGMFLPACPMKNGPKKNCRIKRGEFSAAGLTEEQKENNLSAPKLAPNKHTCRPNFLLLS